MRLVHPLSGWVPMRLVLLMAYQGVAVNLYMSTPGYSANTGQHVAFFTAGFRASRRLIQAMY
jgi:hypothetical protein